MGEGASLFGILIDNFLRFDFIIFLLGGLNGFLFVKTWITSKTLYQVLNPDCWIPGGDRSLHEVQEKFACRSDETFETDIIKLRRKMNTYYVIYENLTAVFPLLGLLGTVVSLLPLVSNMGDIVTGLFFSALTSTMWGIVFAIVFKALNGYLSSGIEDNEKNIEIYLQRNTDRLRKGRSEAEKPKPDVQRESDTEERGSLHTVEEKDTVTVEEKGTAAAEGERIVTVAEAAATMEITPESMPAAMTLTTPKEENPDEEA